MLINDIAVLLQKENKKNKAWRKNLHDAECDLFLATWVRSLFVSRFRFFVKVYFEMMWTGMVGLSSHRFITDKYLFNFIAVTNFLKFLFF